MLGQRIRTLCRVVGPAALLAAAACGGPADEQAVAVLNRSAAHAVLSFLDGTSEVIAPCSFHVWRGPIDRTWTFAHRDEVVTSGQLPYRNERRAVAIEALLSGGLDIDVSDSGIAPDPVDPHPCEGDRAPGPSPGAPDPAPASASPSG